jgi:hypothetical protein
MRYDWSLTMAGAVVVCFAFSLVLYALSGSVAEGMPPLGRRLIVGIAFLPALGGALLLLCGVNDWRLMSTALRHQQQP